MDRTSILLGCSKKYKIAIIDYGDLTRNFTYTTIRGTTKRAHQLSNDEIVNIITASTGDLRVDLDTFNYLKNKKNIDPYKHHIILTKDSYRAEHRRRQKEIENNEETDRNISGRRRRASETLAIPPVSHIDKREREKKRKVDKESPSIVALEPQQPSSLSEQAQRLKILLQKAAKQSGPITPSTRPPQPITTPSTRPPPPKKKAKRKKKKAPPKSSRPRQPEPALVNTLATMGSEIIGEGEVFTTKMLDHPLVEYFILANTIKKIIETKNRAFLVTEMDDHHAEVLEVFGGSKATLKDVPYDDSNNLTSGLQQKVKKIRNRDVNKKGLVVLNVQTRKLCGADFCLVFVKSTQSYRDESHRSIFIMKRTKKQDEDGFLHSIVWGCSCAARKRRLPVCYHVGGALEESDQARNPLKFVSKKRQKKNIVYKDLMQKNKDKLFAK